MAQTSTSAARRFALASTLALMAAGAACSVSLPGDFRATAIVGIDEPSSALRLAAARGGADLAGSKQVIARAAASLNETDAAPSKASWLERAGMSVGVVLARTAPARLLDRLHRAVTAEAGDGLVELVAEASDAATASRFATAVAEALIAEEDVAATAAMRRRENAAADRLDSLRLAARTAREHLAALGASDIDPADALVAAATSTRTAEARLAAVRAVIAAGQPPLGGGSDLPASVAALQQTYWDLRKQFDKASETLGERHTTVIALRDGVSRSAATLTAEWSKIERAAAGALDVARSHEAVLRQAATKPDDARAVAVGEARKALRRANAALVAPGSDAAALNAAVPFRLVSAAVTAEEVPRGGMRALLAAASGTIAFALSLALLYRPRRLASPLLDDVPQSIDELSIAGEAAEAMPSNSDDEPIRRPEPAAAETPDADATPMVRRLMVSQPSAGAAEAAAGPGGDHAELRVFEDGRLVRRVASGTLREAAAAAAVLPPQPVARPSDSAQPELRDAFRRVAAGLGDGSPAVHGLPSVMLAANSADVDTGRLAQMLAEVAAELGYRVLLVETERAQPTLAASVAPNGEPMLVDAFNALRVVLPADRTTGLFMAPALREGARIAAALARNTQAEIVEDLPSAFDLVVIDGGRVSEAVAGGWNADRYIRVGRSAAHLDDEIFLETLFASSRAMIGTVADDRFAPREAVAAPRETRPEAIPRSAGRATNNTGSRRRTGLPSAAGRLAPPRRVVTR